MQVVSDPQAPPNMFLIGLRALAGGAGPNGADVEHVGGIVLKQTVQADGSVDGRNSILLTDEPYLGNPPAGPFRLEADLVPFKPELDVIAIGLPGDNGLPFGNSQIDRGGGFGIVHGLNFGWRDRRSNPRKNLAGTNLGTFSPNGNNLPQQFNNGFFMGGALVGETHLREGDVLRFTHSVSGVIRNVQIPTAPSLSIMQESQPISPPVVIDLGVDTVVYDFVAQEFLVTWRGTFLWEDRLELAVLEVS